LRAEKHQHANRGVTHRVRAVPNRAETAPRIGTPCCCRPSVMGAVTKICLAIQNPTNTPVGTRWPSGKHRAVTWAAAAWWRMPGGLSAIACRDERLLYRRLGQFLVTPTPKGWCAKSVSASVRHHKTSHRLICEHIDRRSWAFRFLGLGSYHDPSARWTAIDCDHDLSNLWAGTLRGKSC